MSLRITIYGRPGSGKSTYALKLSQKLNIPLFHLDRHFFVEDWKERDTEEFLSIQEQLVSQEEWVIDGNSIKSLELRYARSHLVLYFNYPRWLCIWRVFKRQFISKDPAIQDRAPGCNERISWKLLTYLWTFEERVAQPIQTLRQKYPSVSFFEVRGQDDLEKIEVLHLLMDPHPKGV